MADVIKVDSAAMNACIAKYTAERAKLLNALQICVKASQLLAQSWAGPSFAICCAKMADTYKNLFQSEQKIDDAIAELRKTISIMEQAEGKIKSSSAALDVGSSPFA